MLTLRIENFDQLADGGPLSFRADRRGFDIGREQHLDWTLPDPTRRISGKHCEVRFQDDGYWLYDVSTNGTFVNRSDRRVQSPYLLADGDQLMIGDYVISVSVQLPGQAAARPSGSVSAPVASPPGDLWASPTKPPPPINRRDLMAEQQRSSRAADFLNSIADLPPAPRQENWQSADPAAVPPDSADLWAPTGVRGRAPSQPAPPPPYGAPEAQRPSGHTMASVARDVPFAQPPAPRAQPSTPRAVVPEAQHPPAAAGPPPEAFKQQTEAEFLRQFAVGAGIAEAVLTGRRAPELAYELGSLLRLISTHLMHLLKVRAETKGMVRSAERTMIQARDNNALKFSPTPEAALANIFGPPTSGYLDMWQTFERGFSDILAHEEATFAAMQQALQDLLSDLSPEAITGEDGTAKRSFLGGSKSRHWETFVEHWTAKAAAGDNGMLDAFLDLFAAYYDEISSNRRQ